LFQLGTTSHCKIIHTGRFYIVVFAAVIIAKKNAEDDLRQLLENSTTEPTLLTVNRDNIRRLRELMNNCENEG